MQPSGIETGADAAAPTDSATANDADDDGTPVWPIVVAIGAVVVVAAAIAFGVSRRRSTSN
jgi:hypothetical protein